MATKKSGTTAEEKQVVTKEEAALPIAIEELEALSGQGFEGADLDSYAVPFLRILQKNSPQTDEMESSYIENSKPGMFFNTITGELYDKEIDIIPVYYSRSFIEWKPNRGGFVKDHGPDPKILDRVVEIDDKNNSVLDNGNIVQDTRNHYLLLADQPELGPIIMSLSSSGIKHSKKWMSMMSRLMIPNSKKQAPMYAGVWTIGTSLNKNDDGSWYQIGEKSSTNVHFSSWVNKNQLDAAQAAREMLMSGDAKADWDSTVDNGSSGGGNNYSSPSGGGDSSDGEIPF